MIDGVSEERFKAMTRQEHRWLDNIKKAFYASDVAYLSDEKKDRCFPELCKAVDVAKTLQRSLRDEDTSTKHHKDRFIAFLQDGMPDPASGGYESGELIDARTGHKVKYTFAGVVYAIRCMVHENENLDSHERPNYHIHLDWNSSGHGLVLARQYADAKLVLDAELMFSLLRQRVARFVTSIDTAIAFIEKGIFNITIAPPFGSIRPRENFVYASLKDTSNL